MRDEALAMRYAKALFELAREEKREPKVESELLSVAREIKSQKAMGFFGAPIFSLDEKKAVLKNLADSGAFPISPLVFQFLTFLMVRNRFYFLDALVKSYHQLMNESEHREEIVITTARPIRSELKIALEKTLGKLLGEKIVSETKLDPNILGGIQVKIKNRLFDGSIRTKLDELKKQMVG
ncbi:MAG: ATP synthase F1 subunit delta [Candidatus Omnitrophica bacterium]|nr:ATP synthase F1 subunit delta [Candidatus Omnitrophota bacterium]